MTRAPGLLAEATAVCRGCGRALKGKPYHLGGDAYHPDTNERCPSNWYGGFVCSRQCDYNSSLRLEQGMPQHQGQTRITGDVLRAVERNWPEKRR